MLAVDEIGSFHIGGRSVSLPVGDLEVEQMYVHYVRLVSPSAKYPLLMWHGAGATGVVWETTPDGRPGWQMFFLRAGYDVFVSDAVERGRASWAPYPEVFKTAPEFFGKQGIWDIVRLGAPEDYNTDPGKRVAHPGHQFPLAALDQLSKSLVPLWRTNNEVIQRAYDALIERVGPCVLIVCSQSGQFGLSAALAASEKIKALVLLEPVTIPHAVNLNVETMVKVPHLFVWGDFIDRHAFWPPRFQAAAAYRDRLRATGGVAEWFELPKMGIHGNGHTPMLDSNSDQVAELVRGWLNKFVG
jgi:pimeloyl-ACP methyl ester carboxylesterase